MPTFADGRRIIPGLWGTTATVEVRRDDGLTDAMRRWAILVNDAEVGQVRRLRTTTVTVGAGRSVVQIRIWLYGSPHLVLDLAPDEHAVLTCRPRHGPFRRPRGFTDRIVLERLR